MQAYRYIPVNGHPVAQIDGHSFLLDAGLPASLGDSPVLVGGEYLDVEPRVQGLTVSDIEPSVGVGLDGVLGANLFERFAVRIDPLRSTLDLNGSLDDLPTQLEVDNLGGVAVLKVGVSGHSVQAMLGLGLSNTLVSHRLVARRERAGVKREVFGHIGAHEMPLYWLPVALGGRVVHLRCGVMPPALEGFLALANVEAVLGYDLLRHYAMALDMRKGRLALGALQ